MGISKDDYILRNFSKIQHKSWELYVITRIIHLLNDPDIEFVCQQLVKTSNGNRYFADLCFPTLKLYIEIDELHHTNTQNQTNDELRKNEIIDATDFDEKRIPIFDSKNQIRPLKEINNEISNIIDLIKEKKEAFIQNGDFLKWDFEHKFSPEPHIDRGYLDVNDNVSFLTHREALMCFGYSGGNYQRATWKTKDGKHIVWFPKLYKNQMWNNSLSDDSNKITMQLDSGESLENWYKDRNRKLGWFGKVTKGRWSNPHIVFAHYKNVLGQTVYKFLGQFEISSQESDEFSIVFIRNKTRIILEK